jgi:hypothetical protein
MATGERPTLIAVPTLPVTMEIGVTVPEAWLATSTTFPFGLLRDCDRPWGTVGEGVAVEAA